MIMDFFQEFSKTEDSLIRQFNEHIFFKNFAKLSESRLKSYLMQKWFLSFNFVQWYDKAILGLMDSEAVKVLKEIVEDENPINLPSHREDLLFDLKLIGISKKEVLTAKPTKFTLKSLKKLMDLVDYSESNNHDLIVLSALRVAGEVLVGEEYRHLVPELEKRFGLTKEKSRFYFPHFKHDRKDSRSGYHTSNFDSILRKLISNKSELNIAERAAKTAFKIKLGFFDQFIPKN